ncbi:MAG: hypothetical protein RSD63_10235 [Eubacterium sp.]
MNYLKEINCFERWLETNYLPGQSQLLWYKIMMLCNRCGWAEWITVDNQRLMGLIQVKREATFIDLRNKLVDEGLIEYQKGKKGSPNRYKVYSFDQINNKLLGVENYNTFTGEVQTEVYTGVQSVVQSEVQTGVYTVDINKLNKTKTKLNKTEIKEKEKREKPPARKKPEKHVHGEFKHVRLSDSELEKLKTEYPYWLELIKKLDEYKEMTGKIYANDYMAIRKWVVKAVNDERARSDIPKKNDPLDDLTDNIFLKMKLQEEQNEKQ